MSRPSTGPDAPPLPAWSPPRPRGGVGREIGASENGYPVAVVVVVVSLVIFLVPVPEVDIDHRLW